MEKRINHLITHGTLLTTLFILPIVWSSSTCNEVSPGEIEVGVGTSPAHAIPANDDDVKSWFSETILHARDRKDVVKSELVSAEAKTEIIKVKQDGSAEFKTITEALESAKGKGKDNRVVIDIGPGFYNEKIIIDRPYVTLYGDPKHNPQLVYDATTPKVKLPGDTATLVVKAHYFMAVNMKISNFAELKDDQVGYAVTLSANYAAFYNSKIGARKTVIYDNIGNHFFKDCVIDGSATIIVGEGRSMYLGSMIHVRPYEPASIIAGQMRLTPDPRGGGFVFAHCWVVGDLGAKAFLGRTDLPYARVLYAYSELTDVIQSAGWLSSSDVKEEKTGFYGEYQNTGERADTSNRLNRDCIEKLTETSVQPLLTLDFIYAAEWLLPAPKLAS